MCEALRQKSQIAAELAAYLDYMRRGHECSIARDDPAVRQLINKLTEWERLVRGVIGGIDE